MEMLAGLSVVGAGVLGASCGLRIFLAPFVLCLLAAVGGLPVESSTWMVSPWASVAAMGFLLVELGGDKLPGVDQALDAAGLVLRPAWAVGIVFVTVPADQAFVTAGIAGAGALILGLGKARVRVAARDVFPGEDGATAVVSPILSLVEDLVAAVVVLGAVVVAPLAAVGLVIVAGGLHVAALLIHRWRWQTLLAAA